MDDSARDQHLDKILVTPAFLAYYLSTHATLSVAHDEGFALDWPDDVYQIESLGSSSNKFPLRFLTPHGNFLK